jgi:hypothetical protein
VILLGFVTLFVLTACLTVSVPPPGSLAVVIQGLPGSATANVNVSGPNGFSQAIVSTTTITGLVSGVYSVGASNVAAGGSTYAGSVSGSPATVVSGATSVVTVNYVFVPPPPPPPAISNLRSQVFYCTRGAGNITNYKFKFDVRPNQTITGIEVYLTNWATDTPPSTPSGVGGPVQGPVVDNTPVTNSGSTPLRTSRAVQITSSGDPNDAPTLGGFVGTVSANLKPQAIGVNQATLWVRAKLSGGGFSNYLSSQDGMVASADSATCNTPIGNVP